MKAAKALVRYFKDSWQELTKVQWPSRSQSIRLTVAVIAFTFVFVVFTGFIDFGLTELVRRIIGEPAAQTEITVPAQDAP